MTKEIELQKSKRLAMYFLAFAALTFISTLFLPAERWWVGLMRAISEAAMVGALADWFAVVALFKRVPIPIVSAHTEIIPKNKDKIADNLALFVREKFLDVESIVALIQKHDPAQKAADWLCAADNTKKLGTYLVKITAGMLDFIEDAAVQKFMTKAIHAMLDKIDLSQSAGMLLDVMTKNNRHQALLNEGINQFASILAENETQTFIAEGIVDWLKDEHPVAEKIMPSGWVGRTGADIAIKAASRLLNEINENPDHQLRIKFDGYTKDFITRLKTDPEFFEKAEEIKRYLKNDETFNTYMGELWRDLKDWLKRDCADKNSVLHQKISAAGQWLGETLAHDANLRQSLNQHMEDAAKKMAPDFALFLTAHIRDTVKGWDSKEMSRQIELNIGKDLQYIRINGTIVGGCIGCLLYLISHAQELFQFLF
ncbi:MULTISPECIES: DUF445 domain-containing protein [Cellvibrio]|uniref:Uncharacterized membrane-anchored protein YjiN (DUF445 family) n=1 Tax=Cellvibrio fibrivorans TaxID=126350 RepID=A0ABU1V2A3_9GAMM|nr:DUF445 family protein [Cellvibrio fibrivorans]MDR7091587.1 uncharacterized membrane-anchored protein YjiN (DUF445 family) [Cellvibrio fibrivorans]